MRFARPTDERAVGAVWTRHPRDAHGSARVPLDSDGEKCVVRFEVERTAIPKVVTDGRNSDPRVLGLHFNRFDYKP